MARRFNRPPTFLLLLTLAVFLPVGCKSTPKPDAAAAKTVSVTDEQIFIGDTVEKNYDPNVIMKRAEAFFDLEDYEKLLKDYPGNKYQTEARDRIHACQDFIAQAHYFVGKFYYRREAYLAAAHRFEAIVKEYPEMEVASDAMYDLARTYHDIGADDWAQERLFALEQQYPNHKHKAESQKLYAALKVTQPPTALAKAT